MSDILQKICNEKRRELDVLKSEKTFDEVLSDAFGRSRGASFKSALNRNSGTPAVIAELKKASPSMGVIREDFDATSLAELLEKSGAAALSILTEKNYFLGGIDNLKNASSVVEIPLLRKDFIFDKYQIAEARANGASAILLIARMLSAREFSELFQFAKELSLDVLSEAHNEDEIKMLSDCGADIIGVNCRNLKSFETDFSLTERLLGLIPDAVAKVAESAIESRDALLRAGECGADAALIGTALMSKKNPDAELRKLLGDL